MGRLCSARIKIRLRWCDLIARLNESGCFARYFWALRDHYGNGLTDKENLWALKHVELFAPSGVDRRARLDRLVGEPGRILVRQDCANAGKRLRFCRVEARDASGRHSAEDEP